MTTCNWIAGKEGGLARIARLGAGKLQSSLFVSSAWNCVLHQLGTRLWAQELVRSDGTSRRGGRFVELYTVSLVTCPALLFRSLGNAFSFYTR